MIAFNRDEVSTRETEPLQFQSARGYPNILCGIDTQTSSTWFAFNKKTGDFACLTNFRTRRNFELKKDYTSRGFLVFEYVKINDPGIPADKKLTLDGYLNKMYNGTFKGFNVVFGNIRDYLGVKSGGIIPRETGRLRHYSDPNLPDGNKFEAPCGLAPRKAHALSNSLKADDNNWPKVT